MPEINTRIFDLSPLPSWIYSLDTFAILDVNLAALSHYGYTREEFLSLSLYDLHLEEDIAYLKQVHQDIKAQAENISIGLFTHKSKSGENMRMDVNGHLIEFNSQVSVVVVCHDVTENERQLELLQESEQRLKAAYEIARLGYWKLELDTNNLSWTDEVYTIWGREREDFEANYTNFRNTIHPKDLPRFELEQHAALMTQKELDVIHRIILPDKRIRWVHELGRLTCDKDGKPIAFEGTVRDITEQIEEEQKLKLLESVITHTNDAVLITEAEPQDEPGPKIIYVNEAFTKMTGYEAHEVIGKSPRFLQGPNSDRKELKRLGRALRKWQPCEITTINYKKNGDEFWINFSVSPVADEKGWFTHWIAIERDVTEQKNLEFEKELLNRISVCFSNEEEFLSAAHELCKTVKAFGNFDLVELWCPNMEQSEIQLIANFVTDEAFYADNISSFKIGNGLPGKVWLTSKQLLWNDRELKSSFKRKKGAAKLGLKSVLGIPLLFQNTVAGVLVIGTNNEADYLKKFSRIFRRMESIGSEINRKRLENDLKHLYDSIPDILCTTDFNGRFLKMNKAGCDLIGYSQEELLYHPFYEFLHPEDQEISQNEMKQLKQGEKTFEFENRYITKDGRIIWLSWNCSSDIKEKVIFASAKNITAEKQLRQLNNQANRLAKFGAWEVDIENDKVYWSDMVHQLHETDPNSFTPNIESAINFYHEDFRKEVSTIIENCIETGVPFDFEAIIVTKTLKERWIRTIGNIERVNGLSKRIYGSFQDIHESKLMELRISEILGSISDAFYALDTNWRFTYFNKEAERLLKRKEPDLIGNNIWDAFPATVGTLLQEVYFRVAEIRTPESFEYLFPGDGKWYELNAYPSNDGISVYFKNIDARKQAEDKLKKAYDEKNTILESIGDAFFAVDKNWIITYWNKQAEIILGRKREYIIGKYLWEEYPDAIDTDFYRQYNKAMSGGETINFEEYYEALDMWVEVTVYPSDEGLSVYFKDITLRKKADIRLVQANERFEKVTEATHDAIWDWDLVNKVFYRSENIRKFFGKDTPISLNQNELWMESYHPADLPEIQRGIQAALENPDTKRWEMEYRIIDEKGTEHSVIDRGVIIRGDKGRPIRMVGALTDLTNQKKLEKQLLELNESLKNYALELERSNEELEQFAFVASHDLQEPLRMITSFMDLLRNKYNDQLDEKALQYIYFATDGAKRMKQIILDLLAYSRAGRPSDGQEEVDLNHLISEYKLLRRKIISEKGVSITHDKLPSLLTSKAAISQVFHSLMDNAIKYGKEETKPKIVIKTTYTPTECIFSIKDNGIGIDPAFFDKIFVVFQRLHNRDQYDGTGIGLSVAKRHIEFFKGRIWLESTPGKGSTFYFSIPNHSVKH